MPLLTRVIRGARALFRRRQIEDDLDAELHAFLDAAVDQKIRAGLSREESARRARAEMGSVEAVKDRVRDVGWETVIESVWRDVRYALRTLRRSPGFTAVAVLTLSLGIGATTAIFSLLDAIIFKSLPVRNPEELAVVNGSLHFPVFQAFRRHKEIFVDLFATSGVTELDVEVQNGVRERAPVSLVSGAYFSTLGIEPAIGRLFTVDDDVTPGAHPVAVASHAYWQRRFGRDPAILDRVVRIGGTPVTIVGVAPAGFFGEQVGLAPDVWVPLTMWGQIVPGRNLLRSPGTGWLRMVGRIRPGVSASGAHPVLTETFRQVLAEIFGPGPSEDVRRDIAKATVTLQSAANGVSSLRTRVAQPLRLLMGAVVLVLVIACANVANLLLARAAARRREIDVRLALGMSRSRLVRQLLTESLVLGVLGGAAGVALAWIGTEGLLRMISAEGSRLPVPIAIDARLLSFVTLVSSVTVVLSGLAPAWQSTRPRIVTSQIPRGSTAAGPSRRISSVLVVGQIAVSLVLLMGAGLFLRTMANLREVDLGFVPERLIVLDVMPHGPGYAGARAVDLNRRLLDAVSSVPGASSVSLSESGLLTARDFSTNLMRPDGLVAGPDGFPRMHFDWVGPRYFSTIGAALVAGRDFSERDDVRSPNVIAINQEMARQLFSDSNPIGRRLLWGADNSAKPFEIVAVVRDVKQSGPKESRQFRVYLPYLQMPVARPNWIPASTRFLVRTAAAPATLVPILRHRILSEDQRLSIASVEIGSDLVSRTLVQERAVATLLVAFGAVAAGLACVGLYGLIAYYVLQRTSEIGVRMALGAQRPDVVWMMLRRALAWIGAGVAIGIPMASGASRFAEGMLFGLSPTDISTLIGAASLMCALGLLAALIPARRASRVDPLVALRIE